MNDSKYFFRKTVYVKQEGNAALVTSFEPTKTAPLEPWMSLIFLMADGLHTVEELKKQLLKQYKENVPSDYERTIESVMDRLIKSDVVGLSEKSMDLPSYLKSPFDEQDQKKSMKTMLEDGYLKIGELH